MALFVICAESNAEAVRSAKCSEYWLSQTFLRGQNIPFPDRAKADNHNFTFEEKMLIEYRRKSAVIGDAEIVSKNLKEIVKKFAVHELTIVTITSDFEERKNSYRLLYDCMSV
ncbi:MAG: hypothetical protein IPM38_19320 [Ignavibacteria bacterium]|nr:hypothetical protein [Ignavibacteria bacterium]